MLGKENPPSEKTKQNKTQRPLKEYYSHTENHEQEERLPLEPMITQQK